MVKISNNSIPLDVPLGLSIRLDFRGEVHIFHTLGMHPSRGIAIDAVTIVEQVVDVSTQRVVK